MKSDFSQPRADAAEAQRRINAERQYNARLYRVVGAISMALFLGYVAAPFHSLALWLGTVAVIGGVYWRLRKKEPCPQCSGSLACLPDQAGLGSGEHELSREVIMCPYCRFDLRYEE